MNGNDTDTEVTSDEKASTNLTDAADEIYDANLLLDDDTYDDTLVLVESAIEKLTAVRTYLKGKT